jgi:hypothetical protein
MRTFHVIVQPAAEASFGVSFEQVSARLESFDRLVFEPDGSFVWKGDTPTSWQLDGVLYDRDGRVQYLELKGAGPASALDKMWEVLGWPATPLAFQVVQTGETLDEATFRAWLDAPEFARIG